ncbi:MAG: cupredoxin domain-containing protein [Nitrosopumilus sp.]|nr:cupredoxin domain-containing protein [Nitrosopumilus sp.]
MVSQPIWIAIVIGVFFIGIGVSYAHFANTYDPMSMKFQNQELFDQMMTNNPKMSQQWMDSGMMGQQQMMYDPQMTSQWMNAMMDDPQMHQLMIDSMMNHQGMMNSMMNHQDMMNMMMGSGMMSGSMMTGGHMMGSGMMDSGMMSSQSSQSIPTDTEPQTRTFQISMEEVEFFAEVENEGGEEAIAFVELHRWEPNTIIVNQGDTVVLEITNPRKHAHTLSIPAFNVNSEMLEPREGADTVTFVADTPGVFTFYCGLPYNPDKLYCDPDHSMMTGTLIVLG